MNKENKIYFIESHKIKTKEIIVNKRIINKLLKNSYNYKKKQNKTKKKKRKNKIK